MTLKGAQSIVERELKNSYGIEWKEMESHSSESKYYKLFNYSIGLTMTFRISDHNKNRQNLMSTLIIGKSTTEKMICRYVTNRVNDFKRKSFKKVMNKIAEDR